MKTNHEQAENLARDVVFDRAQEWNYMPGAQPSAEITDKEALAEILTQEFEELLAYSAERRFFVEVDSLLSLLVHRGTSCFDANLKKQAEKLYLEARQVYERAK